MCRADELCAGVAESGIVRIADSYTESIMSGQWPTVVSQRCQHDRVLMVLRGAPAGLCGANAVKQEATSTT